MTGTSKIEWTEQTWNPVVGCSIVSPGCTNCYAMQMASRIEAMGNQPRYSGTTRKVKGKAVWTGKMAQAPNSALLAPIARKKPTTYFVNSMGDLFHEDVPDAWIDRVFAVMAVTRRHTYQVLTKRAARMAKYFENPVLPRRRWEHVIQQEQMASYFVSPPPVLPNVWLGVSAERQQEADERIPLLLQTPAAIRFISAEPLLGSIDLRHIAPIDGGYINALSSSTGPNLDWVIAGGESGPGSRPMHPDWARTLRDQCNAASVPFFFKQRGAWSWVDGHDFDLERFPEHPYNWRDTPGGSVRCIRDDGSAASGLGGDSAEFVYRVGKAKAGRMLDGELHDGLPARAVFAADRAPHPSDLSGAA